MAIQIVFETHSVSEDNERGFASGWRDTQLSSRGRNLARELGLRRREDGIQAVFTSDLRRAAETAQIAFADTTIPILHDWRLRECDYGELNGAPVADLHHNRHRYLDTPYPGGESWRQAIDRVGRCLLDLPLRWSGARILVIGHIATRWTLEHRLNGVDLEALCAAEFVWRPGWEFHLP